MATREGIKVNGSVKLIGFIVLIVGSTISVVASIEGMRGDIRVNTEKIEMLREDVKDIGGEIDSVEKKIDDYIKDDAD